ncbi:MULTISPECIES: alpha/beta fold hydrolase [Rhizobium]|uniref:Pimeloyl-ACP methyl ester carboxylesterase n=1 Tax=Rhizobium esperanzae TaxID=1967781 RepID=A0A7W6UMG9_9HYPH|nr:MULTISPECIES: alpha/beta hydrolase [Rhizobium]MBB4439966.1 pimeloyl-ACP methyl ester carboxylesterase [Rhizobium esperanzae]MDH6202467.1 pimeloyl-ACP methyl ester carboxylesterase [Rhizobium leguminosarum]
MAAYAARIRDVSERMINLGGNRFRVLEQGQGPAVLFAHGFPDTADTWRSQLSAVAEQGYRGVALDMRGFGASYSPPEIEQYTSPHIVGDFIGLLDALEIPACALVGHDWGADHAQKAMLMRPDRFRALVSVSIPYAPRGEESLNQSLRARGLGERYYALAFDEPDTGKRFEPAKRSIASVLHWLSASPPPEQRWDPIDPAKHMLRPAPTAPPHWADPDYFSRTVAAFAQSGFETGLNYYRAVPRNFELLSAFKNAPIRQPSLYVWGADDGLCKFFHSDNPEMDDLRASWPGLVDVVRLGGTGHWVQHEAADRFNAELRKFLQDHFRSEI